MRKHDVKERKDPFLKNKETERGRGQIILLRNLLIFNTATDATEDYIKIIELIK